MKRKSLLILSLFFASVSFLNGQTKPVVEKAKPCKFLSFDAAGKILGRRVELITNSWIFANDKTRFECIYRGIEKDITSGREINLFFLLEESPDEAQAKQIYPEIGKANKNHPGIEALKETGDEAYSHSDRPNFYFIMARKGKYTIRLKINKAVETTSPDELKNAVRTIIEQI